MPPTLTMSLRNTLIACIKKGSPYQLQGTPFPELSVSSRSLEYSSQLQVSIFETGKGVIALFVLSPSVGSFFKQWQLSVGIKEANQ